MRTFTKLITAAILVLGSPALYAQTVITVATFDTLYLSKPDTFYVNYSSPGSDVGFNDGYVHFPCIYDTSYGGVWVSGFAYSNMTDSITSGYTNQYSAKPARGFDSSEKYAVAYGAVNGIHCPNGFSYPSGFYITNSTYAYNSMRDGDSFAKKFGGQSGNDPDWFKVTIHGYFNGQMNGDSVDFYLADYRFTNNDSDYIVNTWKWVDLTSINFSADSLSFTLSSSDTGMYGMNTPAYFCMDNYTTVFFGDAVTAISQHAAKIYPNPATNNLFVEFTDNTIKQVSVYDVTGKLINTYPANGGEKLNINTSSFAAGAYILQLGGNGKTATTRFIKQ